MDEEDAIDTHSGSIYKTKRFTDIENRVLVAKGEWGRKRDGLGVWGW